MGFGTDALVLTLCLTLWIPASHFAKEIARDEMSGRLCMRKVLESYEALKDLSDKINAASGLIIFSFVLEGILFFSLTLKNLLTLYKTAVTVGFFFCSFIVVFYFAADICKQVSLMINLFFLLELEVNDSREL
jgi:hypothetical protein